jgi:hypothetical protein
MQKTTQNNRQKTGHYYFIGDCGQANQLGRCPDCGEAIGGTGHRLVGTSSDAATELTNAGMPTAPHILNPFGVYYH